MIIRPEQQADHQQIRIINTSAFETDADETFMPKELKESVLTGIEGVIQYHETFNQV